MKQRTNSFLLIMDLLILLSISSLYSEEKYIDQTLGYDYITLNGSTLYYRNITGLRAGLYTYPSEITLSLQKSSENPFVYGYDKNGNKKALILQNDDILLLYYSDKGWNINTPFFIGIRKESHIISLSLNNINASSEFKENGKNYSPLLLKKCFLEQPWVENDTGYGIGEYLEFTLSGFTESERMFNSKGFWIFNGFISWKNASLYEKNSRVKKIKVLDQETNKFWFHELEDTPNPQYVDCTGHEGHKIRVIIDDVYKGTKYADTCISGLILVKE